MSVDDKLVYGEIYKTNINYGEPCMYFGSKMHKGVERHRMATATPHNMSGVLKVFSFAFYQIHPAMVHIRRPTNTLVVRASEREYILSLLVEKLRERK